MSRNQTLLLDFQTPPQRKTTISDSAADHWKCR